MTESEKEHEYVMHQKRGHGETIAGEGAEDIERMGAVGEVAERREMEMRDRNAGMDSMARRERRG